MLLRQRQKERSHLAKPDDTYRDHQMMPFYEFQQTMFRPATKPQMGFFSSRCFAPLALVMLLVGLTGCGWTPSDEKRAAVPGAERPFPKLNSVPDRPGAHLSKAEVEAMKNAMQDDLKAAKATDAALRARTKDGKIGAQ